MLHAPVREVCLHIAGSLRSIAAHFATINLFACDRTHCSVPRRNPCRSDSAKLWFAVIWAERRGRARFHYQRDTEADCTAWRPATGQQSICHRDRNYRVKMARQILGALGRCARRGWLCAKLMDRQVRCYRTSCRFDRSLPPLRPLSDQFRNFNPQIIQFGNSGSKGCQKQYRRTIRTDRSDPTICGNRPGICRHPRNATTNLSRPTDPSKSREGDGWPCVPHQIG